MEVPVINRVGDLQNVMGRFPNLMSRFLMEQVPQIFRFWKWGALILAMYAIVNSLLVSFRIQFVRFRNRQSAVTKALLSYTTDDDDDYSSDDDESVSGSSVNEEEEEGVEEFKRVNDSVSFSSLLDFRVAGSSELEKQDPTSCFMWSNFVNGNSVVKGWDEIGLGLSLNFNDPSLILSEDQHKSSNIVLNLIDTRVGRQPVIKNWSSSATEWLDAEEVMIWRNFDVIGGYEIVK